MYVYYIRYACDIMHCDSIRYMYLYCIKYVICILYTTTTTTTTTKYSIIYAII